MGKAHLWPLIKVNILESHRKEMWNTYRILVEKPEGKKLTYLLTYLLTHSLTHSMVQDIIWKADSHSVVKKYPAFFMEPEGSVPCSQKPATGQVRGALKHFATIKIFYGEGLLAPRPTPKLEDHPLSAVRDCLFNIFATTFRNRRTSLHL
jgi:hypothetical protein